MHDINSVDVSTLAAVLGLVLRDGWKWMRNGRTTTQLAVLEERLNGIVDRLERIENKLDR